MALALQSGSVAARGEDKAFVSTGMQNVNFFFKVKMKQKAHLAVFLFSCLGLFQ